MQSPPALRRMRRAGTVLRTSEFALAIFWTLWRADPNYYYRSLGFGTFGYVSTSAIRSAFARTVKKYHPDTGEEPDVEKFQHALWAFRVLGDSKLRVEYDRLGPLDHFLDPLVVDQLMKAAYRTFSAEPGGGAQSSMDMLRERLRQEGQKQRQDFEAPHQPVENWDFIYYFYDEMWVPDRDTRHEWIELFAQTWWAFRQVRPVRIGFTVGIPHVEDMGWGKVFLVSGSPNPFVCFWLLSQVLAPPVPAEVSYPPA